MNASRNGLFTALLDAASRFGPQRPILEDQERQPLTYRKLILASLVLGKRLSSLTSAGQATGILLPNVSGLVVTLMGLNAFGRTVGLLNFTAGSNNLVSAVETGPLPVVVTSRKFVEAAGLAEAVAAIAAAEVAPGRKVSVIYLEDVRREIGSAEKAMGVVRALFANWIWRRSNANPEKPAVILFTSGTEGQPKGVVLTNANLVANAGQIFQHAAGILTTSDAVMNPLPIFHSFGLTAATLMPLLNGMKVILYPSPLHFKQVPKLIAATRATVLFATDTFLQGYARSAEPGDLLTVRYVIAGAERVKDQTRLLWSKTGTTILEGYGATECSPVIACNRPDANRPGSVGRVLPGIEIRIEPIEGIANGGRLYVKGPNVMAGYLLAKSPGVIVPPVGGWHDTGDIVTYEDGFITITGRAKRFAKVGGEMVSLAAVEALCSDLWPDANHVVVSLPDPRKGESLTLVTTFADAKRDALISFAQRQGFAELFVPKSIVVVEAIPVLGSGKVDFPAAIELVTKVRAVSA